MCTEKYMEEADPNGVASFDPKTIYMYYATLVEYNQSVLHNKFVSPCVLLSLEEMKIFKVYVVKVCF